MNLMRKGLKGTNARIRDHLIRRVLERQRQSRERGAGIDAPAAAARDRVREGPREPAAGAPPPRAAKA